MASDFEIALTNAIVAAGVAEKACADSQLSLAELQALVVDEAGARKRERKEQDAIIRDREIERDQARRERDLLK